MLRSVPDVEAPACAGPEVFESVTLAREVASPRSARAVVGGVCVVAGVPGGVVAVAVLLTSELVTNAVRHGAGTPRLRVVAGTRRVRVEVGDDSGTPPVLRSVGLDAEGGRGMAFLDELADTWGVVVQPAAPSDSCGGSGKVVWFELRAA